MSKYLTICDELHDQGYLTSLELAKDKIYGRSKYPKKIIIWYCIMIKPVVLLMRRSKLFTKIIYKITRVIWLRHALK